MSALLEVRGLVKRIGEEVVLKDCAFSLERGRVVGLLGHTGAGKSTLLRVLAGVLRPDYGEILLDGAPLTRRRRPQVAYMGDRVLLPAGLPAQRAISYYAALYPNCDVTRAGELLERMGLGGDRLKLPVGRLTKGTAEKLDLALLLSRDAQLYLLDEPLGGVDPVERSEIMGIVLDFMDGARTILAATHLVHDVEPMLDDVIFLREGSVYAQDSAEGIRAAYGRSVEERYLDVFGRRGRQ